MSVKSDRSFVALVMLVLCLQMVACDCGTTPAPSNSEDAGEEVIDAGAVRGTDGGGGTDGGTGGLAIGDVTVIEGNAGTAMAMLTITLTPASGDLVSVAFSTADVTANEQSDYSPRGGSVTFQPGVTSQTIAISVTGDALNEADETFVVSLSNSMNAPILDGEGLVTIANDDPLPHLSIGDLTVSEAAGSAQFTVTLSAPSGQPLSVDFSTAGGTATAGTDFVNASGTLTFAAGDTTRTITVSISSDVLDEADEGFTVDLSNPMNASISDGQGTALILDDDATPTLSVNDVQVVEGNAGTSNATFTVSLSAVSGQTVTVSYATVGGTATAGTDYLSASGTLTFTSGVLSQTVQVTINADATPEQNETFLFTLSAPVNATLLSPAGTGTIVNDDGAGPSLSISDVSVMETNAGSRDAVFTVTLSPPNAGAVVSVSYSTTDGSATAPADYTAVTGTLTFAAGATAATITVPVQGDLLDESDEGFTVALSGPVNAALLDAQGAGTIVDDDAPPTISISNSSANEGAAGTANLVFAVTLSAASGRPITVDYATADGTATAPADYTSTSGTLTLAPGQTTAVVFVPVNGDTINEANETFVVNLSNPANASLANAQGTGSILNDDALPLLSINDVSRLEGNSGNTAFVFTVALSVVSGQTVMVDYASAPGTATSPSDFAATQGTLTFAPGTLTQSITVLAVADTLDEPNETFFVNLSGAVNVTLGDNQGQGLIQNDDSALPGLSVSDGTVNESSAALLFTVTLSPASAQPVTVAYATADGTATAGLDYSATSGTLTFSAGQTSKTISVVVLTDTLDENNETLLLDLTNATNASLVDSQGLGTIVDDDPLPEFAIGDVTVTEGNAGTTTAAFPVTLSVVSGRSVTVNYATADGTALAGGGVGGSDYGSSSGTLTFPAGTTTQMVTVAINGDRLDEPNEAFVVNLSGAVNATIADGQGVGNITDDDPTPVLIIADVSATEGLFGNKAFGFTVTLSAASGQTVNVDFATANGTATAGTTGAADYVATSGTVTFAPGEVTKTINVQVRGDFTVEPNETFFVNLSAAVNASIGDVQGLGIIENDD